MKEIRCVRVVCEIQDAGGWMGAKTKHQGLLKSADALVAELKRHCNYYEDSSIQSVFECSFCGSDWEVDLKGIPVCCDKAIEEHERRK